MAAETLPAFASPVASSSGTTTLGAGISKKPAPSSSNTPKSSTAGVTLDLTPQIMVSLVPPETEGGFIVIDRATSCVRTQAVYTSKY